VEERGRGLSRFVGKLGLLLKMLYDPVLVGEKVTGKRSTQEKEPERMAHHQMRQGLCLG